MEMEEAKRLISDIQAEQRTLLADAHNRYMHFAGVCCGDGFSEEQITADRVAYPHLLQYTDDGRPSLSDERCGQFMAAVSGLSIELCMAWDEVEFCNEHGDFDELVAKAKRLEKLAISNALEARHNLS